MNVLDKLQEDIGSKIDPSKVSADKLIETLSKPISDKLNQKIDEYAKQARTKIAKENSVPEYKVTDLEVAEYLSGMPTAIMTKEIGNKMEYIGKTTAAGIIIGLALIAIAMIVTKNKNK